MKVLICPDKFKGTLDARAAAQAIARGWARARPADTLDLLPISDGGDGFGVLLSEMLGATPQRVRTVNAARRVSVTTWWWEGRSHTAIFESARTIGLAMLPAARFHPFELDTFGLGKVFLAAIKKGARRCIIGIGGSATNDGGFGLGRSLGWRFLDRGGTPLQKWTELHALHRVEPPKPMLKLPEVLVAVDVNNPLLGRKGASRVYGPQKGLRDGDFAAAGKCLGQLAKVTQKHFGKDFAEVQGAGAAGGLGFGLMAFLGARMQPGMELFASHAKLDERIRSADVVITGEGSIDDSTLMGKGAGYIAERCDRAGLPCLAIGGLISAKAKAAFSHTLALTDLTSGEEAKTHAALWLRRASHRLALQWVAD